MCSASPLTVRPDSKSAIRSAIGDRSVEGAVEETATVFRTATSKADLPVREAGGAVGPGLDPGAVGQRTLEHAVAPVADERKLLGASLHAVERQRPDRPHLQQAAHRLVHV